MALHDPSMPDHSVTFLQQPYNAVLLQPTTDFSSRLFLLGINEAVRRMEVELQLRYMVYCVRTGNSWSRSARRRTLHGSRLRLEYGFTLPESLILYLAKAVRRISIIVFPYSDLASIKRTCTLLVYYLLPLPRSPDSAAANLERKSSVLPTLSAGTTTPAAVVLGDGAMGMAASAAGAAGLCAPAV